MTPMAAFEWTMVAAAAALCLLVVVAVLVSIVRGSGEPVKRCLGDSCFEGLSADEAHDKWVADQAAEAKRATILDVRSRREEN